MSLTNHTQNHPDPSAQRSSPRDAGLQTTIYWHVSSGVTAYTDALDAMQAWTDDIAEKRGPERIWLLQHPPLYTAGTGAKPEHLLAANRFPVFESGRGGAYTYHGPGQRIVYLMLDVRRRFDGDVRAYVTALESWIIAALAEVGIEGVRRDGPIGVFHRPSKPEQHVLEKIASIGVRIRRGVTLHGVSINVDPNLEHFSGIVACGGDGERQTSVKNINPSVGMAEIDRALHDTCAAHFGS